ncbi:MAG: glycoside hydrolase family 2 [Clostridia bacterium]|nr:glycoside hydrolase family 2 [Clostridia bacterium]
MKKQSKSPLTHLLTKEGEALLTADKSVIPWANAYPRPQLRRNSFFCLNGEWEVAIDDEPYSIRVPFCPESLLSGLCIPPADCITLDYRKTFTLPEGFNKGRVILHFGAVDACAWVTLNGQRVGDAHNGGYEAFSVDITNNLQDENVLEVDCFDHLTHVSPYGKQRKDRGGMWYTPVSGIWQTVWLESVPETYIRSLRIDTTKNTATITAEGVTDGTVTVTTPDGDLSFPLIDGKAAVKIPAPRLWSPEDPYLYEFTVEAGEDKVQSYFAFRTLEIKQVNGIPRLCLNGSPYFLHALLDQGYWSDGIYTPAAPECYEQDIIAMKSLGFNTLRKHIKVEPEQFYYDCDRLGMLVMQDMVNNGHYSFIRDTALPTIGLKKLPDKHLHRDKATRKAFFDGMEATVSQLRNHPCIIYWTIFNEGWGQFDGNAAYARLRELDPTRFIDTASGWFKGATSDVDSEHVYFKPVKLKYGNRPMVLSEFGGYAWKLEGHAANPVGTYGYRMFKDGQAFEDALVKLYEDEIIPAVAQGLCGAVYTQVSDIEDETNGLLTYDRRITKVDPERMRTIAEALTKTITVKTTTPKS